MFVIKKVSVKKTEKRGGACGPDAGNCGPSADCSPAMP